MRAIAHGGGTHTTNATPAGTPTVVPAARCTAQAKAPSSRRRTMITTVTAIQYDLGCCQRTPITSATTKHSASRSAYRHLPGSTRRAPADRPPAMPTPCERAHAPRRAPGRTPRHPNRIADGPETGRDDRVDDEPCPD